MRAKANHKTLLVFGTRPEAIKLAPVVKALQADEAFDARVCVTAQHREMLDQVLDIFEIAPDHDLDIMKPSQSLGELTARAMTGLDGLLKSWRPDLVIVQGDTTTAFVATLAAFYHQVPVAHVEAGLRTHDLQAPWPEEANRVLITRLADLHFAPTERAARNLLAESIRRERVFVTGNTVVDALFMAMEKVERVAPPVPGLEEGFIESLQGNGKRLILVTGHRRENFGEGFEKICLALRRLSDREDVCIVYPVHLNPRVQEPVNRVLGGRGNIRLIQPLPYLPFVRLMSASFLVVTDSGGIQEEAPSLGKPVLVMRETTERPEAVDAGTVRLVGTEPGSIVSWTERLLDDDAEYARMSYAHNPYGDGQAATRIRKILRQWLENGVITEAESGLRDWDTAMPSAHPA